MRRAVTLVEVLVGLALAALLAAALQQLLVHAYRTHARLQEEVRLGSSLAVPLGLMQQDLSSLATVNAIELRDNVLRVASLVDLSPQSAALRRALDVRYRLRRDASGNVLLREQREPRQERPLIQPISNVVQDIRFEVFDVSSWHAVWPPSNPRQPQAIRCTLVDDVGRSEMLRVALQPLRWRSHER